MVLTIIHAVALEMLMKNMVRHSSTTHATTLVVKATIRVNSAPPSKPRMTISLRLASTRMPRATSLSQQRPATMVPKAPNR